MSPLFVLALVASQTASTPDPSTSIDPDLEMSLIDDGQRPPVTLRGGARLDRPERPLSLREDDSGVGAWAASGLLLAALGAVAFLTRKQRARGGTTLRVVERSSLGRSQSLAVVEHDGRRLLLGVTEGGIQVLRDDPISAAAAQRDQTLAVHAASVPVSERPVPVESRLSSGESLSREPLPVTAGIAAFERELEERIAAEQTLRASRGEDVLDEDAQLRQKLARRPRRA